MNNGFDVVKDTTPYIAIGTGTGAAALTPSLVISAIGALVGVVGLIMAFYRYRESKRANDLAENRLKWEKEIHGKGPNSTTSTTIREEQAFIDGKEKE